MIKNGIHNYFRGSGLITYEIWRKTNSRNLNNYILRMFQFSKKWYLNTDFNVNKYE